MVPLGSQVTEQLNQLGISPELLQSKLDQLQRTPLQALTNLSAAYAQAAWAPGAGTAATKFGPEINDARVGLAPPWSNLDPMDALGTRARFIFKTYHRNRVPAHASAGGLEGLMGRTRNGAMMVRRLHRDPVLRQAFERSTALDVVRDGRTDGTVSVAAMSASARTGTTGPVPATLNDFLASMDTAILDYAKTLGVYSSTQPEVFFGEGRDLEMIPGLNEGKGGQFGESPSTSGVFGYGSGGAVTGSGGPFGAGGAPAPENGDQADGIDTRILQLKRMMDKRSQMYDLVRSVFDKYDESARTAISNMRA